MRTELEQSFHNKLAAPQDPLVIIEILQDEGFREREVRSTMWSMLARHELSLTHDWEVVNGENHPRQLPLTNFLLEETTVFDPKASSNE